MRMPTHHACNAGLSGSDKKCIQLFGMLRGRPHKEWTDAIYEGWFDKDGNVEALTVRGIDPRGVIWRWVRACHAALYEQVLPVDTLHKLWEPMASAEYNLSEPRALPRMEPLGNDYHVLRLALQRSMIADSADRLEANGGKWRYVCTWKADPDGGWFCVWAADLYSSHHMGDDRSQRACLGIYRLEDGSKPVGAAVEATIAVDVTGFDPINPFDCWRS